MKLNKNIRTPVLSNQRLIKDYFKVKKPRKGLHCQTCKLRFYSSAGLDGHINRETCRYRSGRPWLPLISLPDPCLLRILQYLPMESFLNALVADQRFLLLHGIRKLWLHQTKIATPLCYWVKDNLEHLRDIDFYLRYRRQGRVRWDLARKIKTMRIASQPLYYSSLDVVIWSSRADREKCYCVVRY